MLARISVLFLHYWRAIKQPNATDSLRSAREQFPRGPQHDYAAKMDQAQAQNLITRLSDQQVRLLRLVAAGVTSSKALAQHTGLRPGSIDTYLQAAARQLSTDNRLEAAQRLLDLEQKSSQSPSQLRTRRLAQTSKSAIFRLARAVRQFATGLPVGGGRHAYSWERVGLEIFRVALLGMAGLFTLVLFVLGFLKTFR